MQAAALSGLALAQRIAAARGRRPDDMADLAQGLTTPLKAVAGEEIGQFPAAGGGSGGGGAAGVAAAAESGAAAAVGSALGPPRARQGMPSTARQRKRKETATAAELLKRPVRPKAH